MNRTLSLVLLLLLAPLAGIGAGSPLLSQAFAQGRQQAVYFPGPGDAVGAPHAAAGGDRPRSSCRRRSRSPCAGEAPRRATSSSRTTAPSAASRSATRSARSRSAATPTGIILRNGYIVAEWGDPHRVDMTFSVTKSFLSTTVGLAVRPRADPQTCNDRCATYAAPVLAVDGPRRHRQRTGAERSAKLG